MPELSLKEPCGNVSTGVQLVGFQTVHENLIALYNTGIIILSLLYRFSSCFFRYTGIPWLFKENLEILHINQYTGKKLENFIII